MKYFSIAFGLVFWLVLGLYLLGACDVFLIENGISLNLYECTQNSITGHTECTGPLSP